ncbi:MAG TPA: glycosyltransferase family 4 protein [Solirubrobacteraceae bacterium]|jgi:glycosyltransferase involved in cell wall biosynthesis|nr:glycosyltransferase family 4 protein [Solirubrobacteraceae bacterium]
MALENFSYPEDVRVRAEALELVAHGYAVTVLAPRAQGQQRSEVVDGVRVKRYRLATPEGFAGIALEYALAWVQLSVRLAVELARGAEVIHLHNPPDTLFAAAWLARLCGRLVVFDHHDLAPELYEQKFGPGWPATVLRWCERRTMRAADVVLAANESHRLVAIERGGVDPERVVVVRNGPRESTIVDQPVVRDGEIDDPRLCFVGALGAQDGVRALPSVLARLNAMGLQPNLTIVGDGPEVPLIRRLADELGVLDQIVFTGRVAHHDVPALIAGADVCVDVAPCSPLNHRSTMIKIGEYLAAGRPVVTFELQETRFTAGDCALYARDGDIEGYCELIARICSDGSLRARLARAGVERARELTWEHSGQRLLHAYGLLTGAPRHERAASVEPEVRLEQGR